jgi:hypothetical protein
VVWACLGNFLHKVQRITELHCYSCKLLINNLKLLFLGKAAVLFMIGAGAMSTPATDKLQTNRLSIQI